MEIPVTAAPARPAIRIFSDSEALSRAAADFLLQTARQAVEARGSAALALSGGSTPERLYALLATAPYRDVIPWGRLHFFWADERCVPPEHRESNFRLAAESFLSSVPVPPGNIHRVRGELGPEQAARQYTDELRTFFGAGTLPVFDLIVLGAGADGHTASLFPRSALLQERIRTAAPVFVTPPNVDRVTLTMPVLTNAAQVLFLATGPSKAAIAREILEAGNPSRLPAGLVQPHRGNVLWMLDRDAASGLAKTAVHAAP